MLDLVIVHGVQNNFGRVMVAVVNVEDNVDISALKLDVFSIRSANAA